MGMSQEEIETLMKGLDTEEDNEDLSNSLGVKDQLAEGSKIIIKATQDEATLIKILPNTPKGIDQVLVLVRDTYVITNKKNIILHSNLKDYLELQEKMEELKLLESQIQQLKSKF